MKISIAKRRGIRKIKKRKMPVQMRMEWMEGRTTCNVMKEHRF